MNVKAFLYGLIVVLVISLVLGYFILVLTAWDLEGKVIDYNGEPVPNATVTFTNYEESFKTVSDENGHYVFHNNMLESMEEGVYHVIVKKKIDGKDFVGYEGDYDVKKENTKFDIYFKNKDAIDVHHRLLEIMKIKFNNLRMVSHPREPEPTKMKYESKVEKEEDTVDLRNLGDYYILLEEEGENKTPVVHIDLMYENKVVEKGDVIFNCSLYPGWTRLEGYHEELWNSIGLDEVKNKLTKDNGIIKIWTKYTWTESGDKFSDVIISPLNVFNKRIGKSKSFFEFSNGLGKKFTEARPPTGAKSTAPPHPGLVEAIEIDLNKLGDYTIRIYNPVPGENKTCINLMKGDKVIERGICIIDTNFWMSKGETIDEAFRTSDMFPKLKNTLGLVGVGRMIDENTAELSKDDGIVYIAVGTSKKVCDNCDDVRIESKRYVDKYDIIIDRKYEDNNWIVMWKNRWLL